MLMPADPRQWLPAGHLAWRVLDLAAEMDLTRFGARYRADGQGGRPYHPAMMARLLLYCYCRGRRSSREIEMATFDDVGARVICGGLHPDHSTVAEFVRANLEAACALLPESVKACAREGLVSLDLVAGDGTKLKANASMAANVTAAQLDAQITELEAVIDAEFRGWAQDMLDGDSGGDSSISDSSSDSSGGDSGDDDSSGDSSSGGGGGTKPGKKPKRPELVLERRKAARAQLAARQDAKGQQEQGKLQARITELAARAEKKEAAVRKWEKAASGRLEERARKTAAGQRSGGTRPIASIDEDREVKRSRAALAETRAALAQARGQAAAPAAAPAGDPDAKVNATDPSSLVMPLKKGGFDQLFNVQALATARTQVILAIMRHPSPADVHALEPLMERARKVLDAAGIAAQIRKALFDAGYASDANFTLDIPALLYIAVTREARQAGRSREGRAPKTMLPSWEEMTARLQTDEGRQLYRQRAGTIEPVFAQLTSRLGRTLHYRGDLADAELALWAASHNTLKAIKARAQRTARQARATTTPAALAATAA
jgi:transposase